MKLAGFKKIPIVKAHKWFAWYPVFAWNKSLVPKAEPMGLVWLEYVWCEPWGHTPGYQHFRLDKQGNPLNKDIYDSK